MRTGAHRPADPGYIPRLAARSTLSSRSGRHSLDVRRRHLTSLGHLARHELVVHDVALEQRVFIVHALLMVMRRARGGRWPATITRARNRRVAPELEYRWWWSDMAREGGSGDDGIWLRRRRRRVRRPRCREQWIRCAMNGTDARYRVAGRWPDSRIRGERVVLRVDPTI